MASFDTECSTRLQGRDPPQETDALSQTETHGRNKVHASCHGCSSRRLSISNRKGPGGRKRDPLFLQIHIPMYNTRPEDSSHNNNIPNAMTSILDVVVF